MKAIMLSIKPNWCRLIGLKQKTVEIRKTRPTTDLPFKCYIYCTLDGDYLTSVNGELQKLNEISLDLKQSSIIRELNGRIIGEFVCNEITYLGNISTDPWERLLGNVHEEHKRLVIKAACLTERQLHEYGGKYAWHISDLVFYKEPKELSEFVIPCKEYNKENPRCGDCNYYYSECNDSIGFYEECCCEGLKPLIRPPQSWCYVEKNKLKSGNVITNEYNSECSTFI